MKPGDALPYLDWSKKNLTLNGFPTSPHRLVRADVLEFVRNHEPGVHYDLAVIDPPTFSNSKRTEEDFEVQAAHVELISRTAALMPAGGTIFFSNNFRQFKLDEEALTGLGLQVREISRQTVPEDFRNERIHRCGRLVVGERVSAGGGGRGRE